MQRRPTDPPEPQRRPTLPSEKKSGRVQDKYPAYNDFPWAKIEEYLKTKCPPEWDFKPQRVRYCAVQYVVTNTNEVWR
jgi:hypothetical protein